jgi:hypothetical protein
MGVSDPGVSGGALQGSENSPGTGRGESVIPKNKKRKTAPHVGTANFFSSMLATMVVTVTRKR